MSSLDNEIFVDASTSAAAFIILYYDYLLTLSMERDRYWTKHSLNWPGCLFFANRYIAVVGHIPVMYQTFGEFIYLPTQLKDPYQFGQFTLYHFLLVLALQICTTGLMIIRMYALYGQNSRMLCAMLALAAVPIALSCWVIAIAQVRGFAEGPLDVRQGHQIAITWGAFQVFDTVVFMMTMWRVFRIGLARPQPLLQALLKDGILYYIVLLGVNLINIISLVQKIAVLRGMMATISNILSVTIMSRLMLNIRDPRLSSRVNGLPSSTALPTQDPVTVSIAPQVSTVIELEPRVGAYTMPNAASGSSAV